MTTIPELRGEMTAVADIIDENVAANRPLPVAEMVALSKFLRYSVVELYRRPPFKRAPRKHARVTKAIKQGVWAFYKANPHASNVELAQPFNIDGGRVSEILAGFRT